MAPRAERGGYVPDQGGTIIRRAIPYLAAIVVAALLGALIVVAQSQARPERRGHCPKVRAAIVQHRVSTWKAQDALGQRRTRVSKQRPASCGYAAWVRDLWAARARRIGSSARSVRLVVRRLNAGLARTPMRGTGRELEAAGRRWGVHPAFIAAIACTESSCGVAMCGHFNAYGLGNCTGIWRVPAFGSWGESYRFMARYLRERWPSARTTYDFHRYAKCSVCWGAKTAMFMRRFGFGSRVRYAP